MNRVMRSGAALLLLVAFAALERSALAAAPTATQAPPSTLPAQPSAAPAPTPLPATTPIDSATSQNAGARAVVTGTPAAGSMRMEDAIALALTKNERGKIADLNDAVADAAVEKARAGFLPVVTFTGGAQFRPETYGSSPPNIGTATALINQPIVNVPAWPLYSSAKANLDSQKASTVDAKRLIAFDTAKAYLGVLNATEVLVAAQRRLESAKHDLEDTKARAEAALTSTNDVTRSLIALSSASTQVETDKGIVDASFVALEFLLNARTPQKLEPPTSTLDAALKPLPPIAELIQTAVDHRPDVAAQKYAVQAARDSASEPLLRIIPTLNLTGQANTSSTVPAIQRPIDEFLGLSLTWTIYDAGARYADKHSRDALADIADLNLVALVRSVDAQVKTAVVTLIASQSALRDAERQVKTSQQSADETDILYRQGLAKAIELVDANDQVFLAETNYVSSEYAMAQAYVALRQALGLMPIGSELK